MKASTTAPKHNFLVIRGRFFKAVEKPTNNLSIMHQEKAHWTLDTHHGTRTKRKDVREASTFDFRILHTRQEVTLRNSPVKPTFIRIKKGNLQYKCGEQKLLGP